jgi:manganese-transporting P-type ATPase
LEAFPDDEFRWKVMGLVFLSLGGTFIWDRLITAIFAPDIFSAMVAEAKKTTFADIVPILTTAGKVAGGLFVLANGNILVIGGIAYYYYQQRKKNAAQLIA